MSVVLEGVSKSFGRVAALRNVHLRAQRGTLMALLGPSGCGKTTLLRVLAGFETPDSGRILIDDVDVTRRAVGARDIGFVFQGYALFPHQTVAQNIAFALTVRKRPAREIRERVEELLELVGLGGFGSRRPHELSGGQRQRVALARALAADPAILLLDEPFAALDAQVRKGLRRWLRDLHERTHVTTFLVTHDADEAMEIADRTAIFRDGEVQQQGSPAQIYAEPANAFVMRFFGEINALSLGASEVYVRPTNLRLDAEPFASARPASVRRVSSIGARTHVELVLADGSPVTAELDEDRAAALNPRPGMTVYFQATRTHAFAGEPA